MGDLKIVSLSDKEKKDLKQFKNIAISILLLVLAAWAIITFIFNDINPIFVWVTASLSVIIMIFAIVMQYSFSRDIKSGNKYVYIGELPEKFTKFNGKTTSHYFKIDNHKISVTNKQYQLFDQSDPIEIHYTFYTNRCIKLISN